MFGTEKPVVSGQRTKRAAGNLPSSARSNIISPASVTVRALDSSEPSASNLQRAEADSASARRTSSRLTSGRSEEHTSELQSLMRISYAVFCLKKKKIHTTDLRNN